VWIYARVDAGAFMEVLGKANVPLLAVTAALLMVHAMSQGAKWWVLMRRFVPDLKLGRAVSVHMESAFYSTVLPSAAAQDVVKSLMLSKTHDPSVVWASSWLSRLLGFFALLLFSVVGVAYLGDGVLPQGFRVSLIAVVAVIAVLGAASFSKKITSPFRSVAVKIVPPRIMAKMEKLREGIYMFRYERGTLMQTFLISSAIQLLGVFMVSLVVYAISGRFYFFECLALVPLVEIMAVSLPLTPGGVGIREALMALLFTHLGLSGEEIASYVTISLALSMMVRLAGGVPILCRMTVRRRSSRP
jgi:hypothetical protein